MRFGGIRGGALRGQARGLDRWLGLVLLAALVLLLFGLFLPAIEITSFFFLSRDLSLFDSVLSFFDAGNYFLFVVTVVFTIIFPTIKIVTGLALWHADDPIGGSARSLLDKLAAASKWSMLDVFIIALVVLIADGRLLSGADIRVGAIVFAGSVVLSTWAVRRLSLLAHKD